jgi:hypothetical protein
VRVARKFAELQEGRRVAGPPKSSAGVRTVALPAALIQVLAFLARWLSAVSPAGRKTG